MDGFDDLVREACRLIRQGAVVAAYAQLRDVATRVRTLPAADTSSLGPRLYAWLTWIGDAAEAAAIAGAPVDADAAGQFGGQQSAATLVDRFEAAVETTLDGARTARPPAELTVARAKRYMKSNFHRGVRVGDVARAMGCTPRRLRQLWRPEKGADSVTPSAHLRKCRVGAGKRLLEHASKSIAQIADEVGYSSTRGFEDAFKKLVCMTPSAYRRSKRAPQRGEE